MVAKKFLNEERYIESFIASKSQKFGSLKVKYLLQNKVQDQALVSQIYAASQTDELALARQIWQRKFGQLPLDQKERAKQIRFLLGRGFSLALICRMLNSTSDQLDDQS